jgi:hypothetical protein
MQDLPRRIEVRFAEANCPWQDRRQTLSDGDLSVDIHFGILNAAARAALSTPGPEGSQCHLREHGMKSAKAGLTSALRATPLAAVRLESHVALRIARCLTVRPELPVLSLDLWENARIRRACLSASALLPREYTRFYLAKPAAAVSVAIAQRLHLHLIGAAEPEAKCDGATIEHVGVVRFGTRDASDLAPVVIFPKDDQRKARRRPIAGNDTQNISRLYHFGRDQDHAAWGDHPV